MRIAAIDVGTNSIHLVVAEVDASGRITVIERARTQVMLGRGGLERHRIADDAFQRGLDALVAFKAVADGFEVEDIHTAATSAVREAENGADFCRAVRERTGIHVRIVSGPEEARLVWLGARDHLDYGKGAVMLCDLGGGSTELVLCDPSTSRWAHSFPLGHIRLAERFHRSDPLTADERRTMKRHVRAVLAPLRQHVQPRDVGGLVGTSGTIRALARIASLRRGEAPLEHEEGLVLYRRDVEQLLDDAERLPKAELARLPGFDERRRDTLVAGAVLVREIMKAIDVERLTTSEFSLRDGLIVDWIEKHRPEIQLQHAFRDPRERSVRLTLQRFGRDDVHDEAVAAMALQLFDATAPLHQLGAADRDLLHAGALLHDIGHHIAGKDHARHGQYLLKHIRMYGYTAPEVTLLANVVRYHSGGLPKKKHPDYAALTEPDRHRVRVLAGLVRLADAFDRSHTQPVRSLELAVGDAVSVIAHVDEGGDLERWSAEERRDLLEVALGCPVRVEVVVAPLVAAEPTA